MNNRNQPPSNKEFAAGVLAMTAFASLAGASAIYAANYDPTGSDSGVSPESEHSPNPDNSHEVESRITPSAQPVPTVTPTSLPTIRPHKQITLSAAEVAEPSLAPTPKPTLKTPALPEQQPKPVDTELGIPILPVPDVTPKPEISPTPEIVVPTPDTDTPTVDVEKPEPKPEETPVEKIDLHPELLSVPEAVSEIMERRAVHLPALGCSGFTIENPAGEVIGVETAQHCGMLGSSGNLLVDKDGNASVTFYRPMDVVSGDNLNETQLEATIDKFILHGPEDMTKDYALGIAEGHTAEEVFAAVEASHLTAEEVHGLEKGSIIYNAGYPIDQPENKGATRRQEFAMSVLGTTNWTVTNGLSVNLLIAAVPLSEDGAECSWGNSGSEAFILGEDGEPRIIGTASAFNDFGHLYNKEFPDSGAAVKAYAEQTFGVNLDGYGALCGFAYETPTPEGDIVIADVNVYEIPPVHTEEEYATAAAEARHRFLTPKFQRHIIDGLVMAYDENKAPIWIEKPAFDYDEATGITTLLWHDEDNSDNHLSHYTFDFPYQLYIRDIDGIQGVALKELSGNVSELSEQKAFTDENGEVFSKQIDYATEFETAPAYYMHYNVDTGVLELHEAGMKGGGK